MPIIAPFKPVRYDAARVGDLGVVWAPPYDVISAEDAEALRARHPNNFVRIILPEGEGVDRYELAARRFESWIADRTLVQLDRPVVYIHRHHFSIEGESYTRTGLWGLVRLESLDAGVVIPHERTMHGPKADRLALMRACGAQLSAIFFISSDSSGLIESTLESWTEGEPEERVEHPAGERHELWRVQSREAIERLATYMDQEVLLIADGHHRYETALAYRDEIAARAGTPPGRRAHEFLLAYVVSERDPGLVLRPTHRVLRGLGAVDWSAALVLMEADFTVRKLEGSEAAQPQEVVAGLPGTPSFALVTEKDEGGWLLTRRPTSETGDRAVQASRQLAAVAFHDLFLRKGLGLAQEAEEEHVSYVRDPLEAVRQVRSGRAQAAALLAASHVAQIREASAGGTRLPPKTTFFWPKVPTGVAIHRIDPDEEIELPVLQPEV